jgi:hypothetical protein
MRFVKQQDFTMYHDVTDGVSSGWTVGFTITYYRTRKPRVQVWAKSPTGRMLRTPKQVSRIMPIDDWPEFARQTLNNNVEGIKEERLF